MLQNGGKKKVKQRCLKTRKEDKQKKQDEKKKEEEEKKKEEEQKKKDDEKKKKAEERAKREAKILTEKDKAEIAQKALHTKVWGPSPVC